MLTRNNYTSVTTTVKDDGTGNDLGLTPPGDDLPALNEEALQKKYQEATGKNAIWRDAETKAYQDWKKNQ